MKTLLIVYHSMTGGTRQMAQAAASGAAGEAGVLTRVLEAASAGPEDVLRADGYVFATPENLAAMSGMMKDFFDRCYYTGLDRLNGRPYAAMICAGSDGENAARQVARIATGWRLREVAAQVIVCTRAQTAAEILAPKILRVEDLARCTELGAAMAAGLALGVFKGAAAAQGGVLKKHPALRELAWTDEVKAISAPQCMDAGLRRHDVDGARVRLYAGLGYLKLMSSTSKISVAPGGMTAPAPRAP